MKYDYQKLSRYLQRLENELQQLGWWSDLPPDSEAFESTAPFCHDRMTLDQWLQWVFIPSFQAIIDQACLRPRDRFWDIPVPKIDSAFDNLLVPQPSWSPSTTQQLRKLVAAPYLAPI
ncbi:YqcC family protein [Thiolapillus sp.]|nr:YqcC family protein [Thiolapillus sp.]